MATEEQMKYVRAIGNEFARRNPRFIYDAENARILQDAFNEAAKKDQYLMWSVQALESIFMDLVAEGRIRVKGQVQQSKQPQQAKDIKIILPQPKKTAAPAPVDDSKIPQSNAEAAAKFVQPLDGATMEATLQANPSLRQALDSQLGTPLDLRSIKIVTPEKVEKFGGVDAEVSRHALQVEQRRVAQRTAAVTETNRGVANAQRGTRAYNSKY